MEIGFVGELLFDMMDRYRTRTALEFPIRQAESERIDGALSRIRARLGDSEPGRLSVVEEEDLDGALSLSEEAGGLSVTPRSTRAQQRLKE